MSIDNISSASTPVLLSFHGTSCSGSFRYNMTPSVTPTALPADLVVALKVQSSSDKGFEPLIGHTSTTDRKLSDRAPATTTRLMAMAVSYTIIASFRASHSAHLCVKKQSTPHSCLGSWFANVLTNQERRDECNQICNLPAIRVPEPLPLFLKARLKQRFHQLARFWGMCVRTSST